MPDRARVEPSDLRPERRRLRVVFGRGAARLAVGAEGLSLAQQDGAAAARAAQGLELRQALENQLGNLARLEPTRGRDFQLALEAFQPTALPAPEPARQREQDGDRDSLNEKDRDADLVEVVEHPPGRLKRRAPSLCGSVRAARPRTPPRPRAYAPAARRRAWS